VNKFIESIFIYYYVFFIYVNIDLYRKFKLATRYIEISKCVFEWNEIFTDGNEIIFEVGQKEFDDCTRSWRKHWYIFSS